MTKVFTCKNYITYKIIVRKSEYNLKQVGIRLYMPSGAQLQYTCIHDVYCAFHGATVLRNGVVINGVLLEYEAVREILTFVESV